MTPAPAARPAELTSLPHSGLSVAEFYSMHFLAAMIPLTAGLLLFGWRALEAIALVETAAIVGIWAWRQVGARGQQLSYPHAAWQALLLAMMLPAHLATTENIIGSGEAWYLLPAAGLTLAMFLWVLGGLSAGRVHPVLVTYLLLAILFFELLIPHWVLQRNHLLVGDMLLARQQDARFAIQEPWTKRPTVRAEDAQYLQPAGEALSRYSAARSRPPRGWLPIQSLIRDELPPLEDLIVGGHPGPIGTASAIAVIIGGLLLLYRGLIDFRIPLLIVLSELAALMVLPTPPALREHTHWHWLVSRQAGVGWASGITFVNYELMASPSLFMAFFLATSSSIRPMSRRGIVLYSILVGALSAAGMLYIGVGIGPYIGLLLGSLATPLLDLWFRPRSLI